MWFKQENSVLFHIWHFNVTRYLHFGMFTGSFIVFTKYSPGFSGVTRLMKVCNLFIFMPGKAYLTILCKRPLLTLLFSLASLCLITCSITLYRRLVWIPFGLLGQGHEWLTLLRYHQEKPISKLSLSIQHKAYWSIWLL